ncbi:MAG: SulP family inorganic anion transporter [Candidatus Gracilibacteria bacterium]|nr:SulP family inorganic anion transporter [Candidatus Gracilibacteria bacterium]
MDTQKVIGLLKNNWKSGLTVAIINIPLSISLAVASGATPIQGIITGIWAGIIASIFASSHYNIFGVAGALTSILLTFVLANGENGVALLPLLAICSGLIMYVIYLLKITKYITLIPSTVLHGFLISVGITIALGQISGALGLNNPVLNVPQHKEIYMNLFEVFNHITSTDIASFLLFAFGLVFLLIFKKYKPTFPAVIVLTIVGILFGMFTKESLPTILQLSDKYTDLTFTLFQNPFNFKIANIKEFVSLANILFTTSLVIAIIAILETIISAKIAEKITKVKFNKDREVLGLALSNMGSGIMGGLPATAVFIRTALNIKSGATHKTSAFLVAIITLVISALLFNGYFKYLPFPIISAILMNIALGLIDINLLKKLYSIEKIAFYTTILTTALAILIEPIYGILAGISVTLLIFLRRVTKSDVNVSIFRKGEFTIKDKLTNYLLDQKVGDILLMKFSGGLNYLNIENIFSSIEQLNQKQTIIISFSHMGDLDIDGLEMLNEMIEHLHNNEVTIYLSGIEGENKDLISKIEIYPEMEKNGMIKDSTSAILQELLN